MSKLGSAAAGATDLGAGELGAGELGAGGGATEAGLGAGAGAAGGATEAGVGAIEGGRRDGKPFGSVVRPSPEGGSCDLRGGGGAGGSSSSSSSQLAALMRGLVGSSPRAPLLTFPCCGGATYGISPASRCRSFSISRR